MTARERETRRRSPCGVLLADDHDETRAAERLVLEAFGFAVTEARTGYDALVIAQMNRPRVVLVDIVLPEIDGCQLARMLRIDAAMRPCAIIAVTALQHEDDRIRALAAGCDDYLVKPVAPLCLVDIVRRYTRRRIASEYDFDPLGRDELEHRNRGTSTPPICDPSSSDPLTPSHV